MLNLARIFIANNSHNKQTGTKNLVLTVFISNISHNKQAGTKNLILTVFISNISHHKQTGTKSLLTFFKNKFTFFLNFSLKQLHKKYES